MNGSKTMRGAALIGLALAASAATTGARAQDGAFMRDLLGSIGIIEPERPDIYYRERAPLVVPPKLDQLPAPQQPEAIATRNPAWPKDPDVEASRAAAARDRIPVTEREERRMLDNNPRLSVDEIRAGRRPGAAITRAPEYRYGDNSRDEMWVHPDKMREMDAKVETGPSQGLSRQALTDPPSGFLRAAPGAPVRANSDPIVRRDEADPKAYLAEERARRRN